METYNESYLGLFSLCADLHSKLKLAGSDDECPPEPEDFIYDPLAEGGHTRLLYILDSASDYDLIQCILVPVQLDPRNMPVYTTISYSWGGAFADASHLDHCILCNGMMLKVTENVHAALRRFRQRRTGPRVRPQASDYYDVLYRHGKMARASFFDTFLWIDSICIDQSNTAEKSAQVSRMAGIYASSASTVVWLGEYPESAISWDQQVGQVLDRLPSQHGGLIARLQSQDSYNRLGTLLHTSTETFDSEIARLEVSEADKRSLKASLYSDIGEESLALQKITAGYRRTLNDGRDAIATKLSMNVAASATARGCRQLIARPWFNRKWVVQEMTLTVDRHRTILLGASRIELRVLQDELRRYGLTEAAVFLGGARGTQGLLRNLHEYAMAECTRPHDHIYSLMGISQDLEWLNVDYELDVATLYRAVAKHYIMSGNGIAVLMLATAKRAGPGLPSWTPDWRSRWQHDRSSKQSDALTTLFRASYHLYDHEDTNTVSFATSIMCRELSEHEDILEIRGWIVSGCGAAEAHQEKTCKKCRLLHRQDGALNTTPYQSGSESTTSGSFVLETESQGMLRMRRKIAQQKWSQPITEQFNLTIGPHEVLCFIENSPFGFVLRHCPVDEEHDLKTSGFYRLQFCFQVDESKWTTNWFAHRLGYDLRESIYLI